MSTTGAGQGAGGTGRAGPDGPGSGAGLAGAAGSTELTGLVHGMGKEPATPDWSPLTAEEVTAVLARYRRPGGRRRGACGRQLAQPPADVGGRADRRVRRDGR